MAEKDAIIANFIGVTGVPEDRARFFLEAANWDSDLALSSFYDDDMEPQGRSRRDELSPQLSPQHASPPAEEPWPSSDARNGGKRIATLGSYRNDAKKEEDGEKGQEFFAGGSEHSGQMISGPAKKKRLDGRELAEGVMKGAKEHGAEVVDPAAARPKPSKSMFTGSGYRLGETPDESALVSNVPAPAPKQQETEVVVHFWTNGFSINDGPLRDGQSDEDRDFLEAISKGVVPDELLNTYGKREIAVSLNRKDSEYVVPKKKMQAFTGSGNRLGSPAPSFSTASASSAGSALSSAASSAASHTADAAAAAPPQIPLDESQPMTTLQIRLADGTRLVTKFNTSHNVSMVREFINGSRPGMAGKTYCLMTAFPSKELSDESITLQAAGLVNAVVMQRMR